MTTNEIKESDKPKIVDDLNLDTLTLLKAKMAKKNEEKMPPVIVEEKKRSIKFGVVGSGQCGSRIAEEMYKLGYEAVAINTAPQDLQFIQMPDANKLLLQYGLGGAAKDMDVGSAAAEQHKDAIYELLHEKLSNSQIFLFCVSLGGGSGAGSIDAMISIMNSLNKPVVIVCALPMESDDQSCKQNSLESLAKLSKYCQEGKVHNIILVDNAQIQTHLSNVSELSFFEVANKLIVDPLETFNYYSSQPSPSKALDSMEFSKLLLAGGGFSTFGTINISDYESETAISEAVIASLESNLLAKFDLKQSRYVGFLVVAPKHVWDKIPSASISYASALIGESCGVPDSLFKGLYISQETDDIVKIYSCFSGLGLPTSRIEDLKKETEALKEKTKNKDKVHNMNLNLQVGSNETVSTAQKVRDKIAAKKGAFNQFVNNIVDKRKS